MAAIPGTYLEAAVCQDRYYRIGHGGIERGDDPGQGFCVDGSRHPGSSSLWGDLFCDSVKIVTFPGEDGVV